MMSSLIFILIIHKIYKASLIWLALTLLNFYDFNFLLFKYINLNINILWPSRLYYRLYLLKIVVNISLVQKLLVLIRCIK